MRYVADFDEVFAPPKCFLGGVKTPKTYSQYIGEDYRESNILRQNAMTKDFHANFPEYWLGHMLEVTAEPTCLDTTCIEMLLHPCSLSLLFFVRDIASLERWTGLE